MKSAISKSIFLSTVRKNPVKKGTTKHFLAVSCWSQIENLIGFSPLGIDISQLVNLSRESQVTRTTSISGGKSVPCNRIHYWMSSRSLFSDDVFLLFISFYTCNTERSPLSCTHLLLIHYSTFQQLFNKILTYTNTSHVNGIRRLRVRTKTEGNRFFNSCHSRVDISWPSLLSCWQ